MNEKRRPTMVRRLWAQLPRVRRRQFFLILLLVVLGAASEVVTLGAVLPFLAFIADPSRAAQSPPVSLVVAALGLKPEQLFTALTALFMTAAVVAGGVRVFLAWASNKFVFRVGYDLSVNLYERILIQPYSYHVTHNSSEILSSLNKVQMLTNGTLLPVMQAISSLVIAFFIVVALFSIEPAITILTFVGFGAVYIGVSAVTRGKLKHNAKIISRKQTERVQCIQEGLGGIRDIILDNTQSIFVRKFRMIDSPLRNAQAIILLIGAAPRYVIESIGMALIAMLAFVLNAQQGVATILPILGVLALGAQRLLPLMQLVYAGWTRVSGSINVVEDVLYMLELPLPREEQASRELVCFDKQISLKNLSFQYAPGQPLVLKDLNLNILKGSKVALIGRTGSGKSTVADLLMGLLPPTSGWIEVDGSKLDDARRKEWRRKIAHVPQTIYLADASIAENIAFGIEPKNIDDARLEEAARQAELHHFVSTLPDGYGTFVGERGIRLSGGQRQRIGIARALYKQVEVLLLDEATSALDAATEAAVMDSIQRLRPDLTIIIVAHRLTTIKFCDEVIQLEAGQIAIRGSYADVVRPRLNTRPGSAQS